MRTEFVAVDRDVGLRVVPPLADDVQEAVPCVD
jgi:hypothetical protein